MTVNMVVVAATPSDRERRTIAVKPGLSHHPDAVAHVCWKTVHKSGTTCGIFHAISADTLIHWKDMGRTEWLAAKSAIRVHGRTAGVRFRTLLSAPGYAHDPLRYYAKGMNEICPKCDGMGMLV